MHNSLSDPLLTVVIPAYNEEKRIGTTLEETIKYLKRQGWEYEIIVVDDGSQDGTATSVELIASDTEKNIRLLRNDRNRGKGYSIRRGLFEARGRYIGFMDADYKTRIDATEEALHWLQKGYDVVIGSRALSESCIEIPQPGYRRRGARIFNRILHVLLGLHRFKDTQCGFKFFKREAVRDISRRGRTDGYMFDVEILWLCERLGYKVREIPVHWFHDPDTRFKLVRGSLENFRDLIRIRLRLF